MNKIIFGQMLPIRTLLHFLFRHYDSNPATFWIYRIQTYDKLIPSFCRLGPIFFLFKYISGCDPKNLGMSWACIISAVCCILSSSKSFLTYVWKATHQINDTEQTKQTQGWEMREVQPDGPSGLVHPCTFLVCDMGSELVGPHVKTQPHLTAFILVRWYH